MLFLPKTLDCNFKLLFNYFTYKETYLFYILHLIITISEVFVSSILLIAGSHGYMALFPCYCVLVIFSFCCVCILSLELYLRIN